MASSSDGPPILPAMPDFSSHSPSFSSAGDMRFHLQNLLDSKEKQLQQAGTLGQRVLAQQMELEERIRQLQEIDADKTDDDEIDSEVRFRYRELAETIQSWDMENAQLSGAFGASKRLANGTQPSPSAPFTDLPREEPERSKASSGTSAAQSRRAKNAAHRADDVEFAFEIGSGLLTEVRRLQSLLGERDKAIQDMKEEKDDLEKSVESLRTALRQQEQSTDKFKEENWNLEVTLQELRTQLSDSQASTQRLEGEHKRITKQLAASRDTCEQHKNEAERLQTVIEEIKAKHETDVAHARKHAAGLQRDKSDLQQTVDTLKAEATRAGRRFPRFGSPLTPNGPASSDFLTPAGDEDDVFSTVGGASTNRRKLDNSALFPPDEFGSDFADSPDPSPARPFLASNHPSNEIEALQQRLAHAQRQINTLKGSLHREKELRMDYKRKLELSPGFAPEEPDDVEGDYEDAETVGARLKPRSTPYRSGGSRLRGRGRGRGGLTLVERLGLASSSPSSEYGDNEFDTTNLPLPVPTIPIRFHEPDQGFDASVEGIDVQENDQQETRSPSPLEIPSNRTSVDGMDPAFANVLRRTPSTGSMPQNGSPLRHIVAARGTIGRRSRGGAAYQEGRPPSVIAQAELLAKELGLGGSPMKEHDLSISEEPQIERAEFGCQTEFVEPLPPSPPPPILVTPAMVDIEVQSEPEVVFEPVLLPTVTTSEVSAQTEEEPSIIRLETAVQYDFVEQRPVFMEMEVQTNPALLVDVDTQTPIPPIVPLIEKMDADTQTLPSPPVLATAAFEPSWRSTITQRDLSWSSVGTGSGDLTLTRLATRAFLADHEEDDGNETETGIETETDTDDYQDARQSIMMSTPTESQDDFHSVLTMTDNDMSESDDDGESIKASRLPSRQTNFSTTSSLASRRPSSPYPAVVPRVSYESKSVAVEITDEAKAEPKPVLKEISIQTDDWSPPIPPAPVALPLPAPGPLPVPLSPSFSLYKVGSSNQQFQFVAPQPTPSSTNLATTSTVIPVPRPISSNSFRESTATFGTRPRTSTSENRQSIETAVSSIMDDAPSRSRAPSGGALSVVDKTKPPMMVLPPPPRLPPPSTSMPPPSFIPERRIPTTSTGSSEIPPPRPSSPPPPELIQRATTPTFGSVLSVPGGKGYYGPRQHGSSMPPSQQGLRQPPSTSSFRSAANAATYAQHSMPPAGALSSFSVRERERRELSTTSLASERSMASPRSSMSSGHNVYANRSQAMPNLPVTPQKLPDLSNRSGQGSTDPAVIHAITQTMIGEFLFKYTRRAIGKGHGQTRHKRFFWVHPYTKTLYWSSADPGSSNVSESSAKSAFIEGVRSVLDPNPMPPGLYQYSVVVSTPQREMKITAPTKERHDIWLNALKYLLARPTGASMTSPANATIVPQSPNSNAEFTDEDPRPTLDTSPKSQRSGRSIRNGDSWNTTPRGQRSRSQISVGGSIGKRSGTPAAEYLRWNGPESPYSPSKSFEHVLDMRNDEELDFELHGENLSDDGFEGLENVRACCDGRHTVGHSDNHHHHHHHHITGNSQNGDHNLDNHPAETARPVSPSAWSFRSHASSQSHEGGIFSWGRGDDGKLRFGSRRSAKTIPTRDQ